MDIEKLKGTWKKYTSELREKETNELRSILKQKSQGSLKKLRKNFYIEAGLNVAAIPIIFIVVINKLAVVEPLRYFLSSFLIILLLLFLIFLYRSYIRIFRCEHFRLSLEKKLKEQVAGLKRFMRNYERITYILYFVAFIFGLFVITYDSFTEYAYRLGLAILIGIALFFAAIRPLTRYYVNKLYGKHLNSLCQYLEELNGK